MIVIQKDIDDSFDYYDHFLKKEIENKELGNYDKAKYYEIQKDLEKDCDIERAAARIDKLIKQTRSKFAYDLKLLVEKINLQKEEEKKIMGKKKIEELLRIKQALEKKELVDLTEREAVLLGKQDEWWKMLKKVLRLCAKKLPPIYQNKLNYYRLYRELNNINEDNETIRVYINLYKEYNNMSYDEIIKDLKRKNGNKHI